MDVLHEWSLEKYGKQDNSTSSNIPNWDVRMDEANLALKLLESNKLVISATGIVLESVSLFNAHVWSKAFRKGESLLLICKVQEHCRKIRIKFKASIGKSAVQVCDDCVKVLKHYFAINEIDSQVKNSQPVRLDQYPSSTVSGDEVAQDEYLSGLMGESGKDLPQTYSHCNYPCENLETLIRLCLIDPNFPSFVHMVEEIIKKK